MPDTAIPLVDLKRQYSRIKNEIDDAVGKVINSGIFIMGENTKSFEKEFADYIGVRYAVGVGSGTDALTLSLRALGIKRGDEVITVSFSFPPTADSIVHNGGIPVFVDIDPETYTIDVKQVEKAITKNTKAVIPVHLYGHPADMAPILKLAEKHGLHVIEDCSQAHGAKYEYAKVGSLGHVGCFSFYPSKNLGAYGDGGIIVTNHQEIAESIESLREYGQKEKSKHEFIGFNSRLDEIQAAVLRIKLKHLDVWNAERQINAKLYSEFLQPLSSLILPIEKPYATHVYHLFVIRCKERDALKIWLAKKGISTGIHYPIPIHMQKSYQTVFCQCLDLTTTELFSREVLSLPLFPELTGNEIVYVFKSIDEFFSDRRS